MIVCIKSSVQVIQLRHPFCYETGSLIGKCLRPNNIGKSKSENGSKFCNLRANCSLNFGFRMSYLDETQ